MADEPEETQGVTGAEGREFTRRRLAERLRRNVTLDLGTRRPRGWCPAILERTVTARKPRYRSTVLQLSCDGKGRGLAWPVQHNHGKKISRIIHTSAKIQGKAKVAAQRGVQCLPQSTGDNVRLLPDDTMDDEYIMGTRSGPRRQVTCNY